MGSEMCIRDRAASIFGPLEFVWRRISDALNFGNTLGNFAIDPTILPFDKISDFGRANKPSHDVTFEENLLTKLLPKRKTERLVVSFVKWGTGRNGNIYFRVVCWPVRTGSDSILCRVKGLVKSKFVTPY